MGIRDLTCNTPGCNGDTYDEEIAYCPDCENKHDEEERLYKNREKYKKHYIECKIMYGDKCNCGFGNIRPKIGTKAIAIRGNEEIKQGPGMRRSVNVEIVKTGLAFIHCKLLETDDLTRRYDPCWIKGSIIHREYDKVHF